MSVACVSDYCWWVPMVVLPVCVTLVGAYGSVACVSDYCWWVPMGVLPVLVTTVGGCLWECCLCE